MSEDKRPERKGASGVSRRRALKLAGVGATGAAFVWAIAPLKAFVGTITAEEFLQRHYKELSPQDKEAIFRRLEAETKRQYGVTVRISDPPPLPNTKFGYALNLSMCIGCRMCAKACHQENNHDRSTFNSYIRVFEMDRGSLDLARGTSNYSHAVPQEDKFYMPIQCHHCDKHPCIDVCPTRATWKEPDGLVVIDYNWCIGCRYCEVACPYHARRFNWRQPTIPPGEINPDQAYLSNRIRPQGVMEKCTFCLHRTRRGRLPACLEACPTGARVFGNLLDRRSEIRWVLRNRRVFILKEEAGTVPSFYYFFSE